MLLNTIAIQHPESPEHFLMINEQEFDPRIHVLFKKSVSVSVDNDDPESETIAAAEPEPKAKGSKK